MKAFLTEIIVKAGDLLMEKFGFQYKVEFKAEGKYKNYPQVVSSVDLLVQEFLIDLITKKYPDHHILSEETVSSFTEDGYTWIIDPIDGTTHFLRGIPAFSVSIAVQHKNEVVMGAVYAPYDKSLYLAEKGKGSFHNQKPIGVSKIATLKESLVATSVYQSYKIRGFEQSFSNVIKQIKNIRMLASSALDICYVASGKLDARIFANTEPWDHAAAALIVEEAGGKVTDWFGNKWSPRSDTLLVTNGILHDDILRILGKNV